MEKLIYKQEAYNIIGACMEVHNTLGHGFAESVYQEALSIELNNQNIPHIPESPIIIKYKGKPLKKRFSADFLCYEAIILEIKAAKALVSDHEAQLLNYLKATEQPLGLLVNFGTPKLQYRRFANTHI